MTEYSRYGNHHRASAGSQPGGCLSIFILSPLAAVAASLLMFMLIGLIARPVLVSGKTENSQALQAAAGLSSKPGDLATFFTPSVHYWNDQIVSWAKQNSLDPNLVATVMQIESCGDPGATSSAGASGLFQVMPFHFGEGEDRYDPTTNAFRGMSYLKKSWDAANGDPRLALAGYNGGIGVIGRAESTWADETRRYAEWGNGIYQEAMQGQPESIVLNEWLTIGGARLCSQANRRLGLSD